ncbi:MAG: GTP-binding protein [Candidatus Lokiarchaeota archaeon]|nr:GTP-binding protein [Candidatus Lokiarchaeota archaeon]MBD3339900.1 GTP-binding protein [Candidatus Lokiarchaeota archaeon]
MEAKISFRKLFHSYNIWRRLFRLIKFKVVIAGDKNVGKTSLLRRYATGKFDKSTLSTIGVDFETKKVVVNDTDVLLNIWDFAGEKKFRLLFPSYVSGASGAMLLYDITNKESLTDLHQWIKIIENVNNPPRTKLLIEHKIDLEDQRKVNREDARDIFEKYNFKGEIIGASAKTGENVEDVFIELGKTILENSLVKCPNCGKHYPIELKFCQYCGTKRF